ncbi:MAG: DUF559 domain-containing protein [Solirubrobacteraceae bacterium]
MEDSGSGYRNKDPSRLAELAAAQHGVVAVWQLETLGYSRWAVARMAEGRRLHRIHRGVYAVGHTRLTTRGRWMAAVLACGPEAVLSHHAAAALWDLRPGPQVHVDVSAPVRRTHRGVRCHVAAVPASDRTEIDGIPVTTLERTLLDYAEVSRERHLHAALESAERRELLDGRRLHALMQRSAGRRGIKPLRAALAANERPLWTQSELERRFIELIRAAGLPEPETNVLIEGFLVDCVWRAEKLVVELDSWTYHRTRRSFESDRRRDAALQGSRFRILRITDERIRDESGAVVADVRHLLTA